MERDTSGFLLPADAEPFTEIYFASSNICMTGKCKL
jgi:hypothetical protein